MAAPTFVASTPANATPTANWSATGATNTTRSTASFSVTAGDLLIVVAGGEDGAVTFSTPTGGSLTWTQQANLGTSGANSRAAMWTATASSTTSITVSLPSSSSTVQCFGFRVYQFSGASIGNVASSQSGSTVAPSQALTTTQANSAIIYIGADWTATDGSATRAWRAINSITPTSGNGLEKDYFRDAAGTNYAVYTAYWNDVGAIGAKTTGLTAPTQKATTIALEIKGTAGSTTPVAKLNILTQARTRAAFW
jgi:hypothetical protein